MKCLPRLQEFLLFGIYLVVLSMGLTLAGLDFVTALSSAATSPDGAGKYKNSHCR